MAPANRVAYRCPEGCVWELPTLEAYTPFCNPACDGWRKRKHPKRVLIEGVTCPTHRFYCTRAKQSVGAR